MAKKINKNNQIGARPVQPVKPKKAPVAAPAPFVPDPKIPAWLYSFKVQAVIVGFLAFALYANTFQHEYALDDTIVIAKNAYVYEGFTRLDSIFTTDTYGGYYKLFNSSNQLAGGRYRPLSIATFAIEQQFLGAIPEKKVDSVVAHAGEFGPQEDKLNHDMHVRHVFNVLWYTLSVIVLLYFLRYVVLKNNPLIAFMAAILFAIHPIHTEVVANVKSRDEILSILFICTTFICAFKYYDLKEKKWLIAGLISFFLALLSKEYGISLLVLLPLALYLCRPSLIEDCIKLVLPYLAVFAIYFVIRKLIVAPMSPDAVEDILNNPYALAAGHEEKATQISTTLNYLKLLIFPHPLSADYSYNSIPYKDFSDLQVWLSLVVHIGLIYLFFYYLKRKSVMAFAIAFYLLNLLLICNIFFNIGGTMGERLIYHSSVGFALAVAFFLNMAMEKIKPAATGKMVVAGCMVLIIGLCSYKTIDRNKYWKNDQTLFFEDIKVQPNSVLVNADVASSYVNNAELDKDDKQKEIDIRKGIWYFSKAIEINPKFVSGYLNRGMAYFKLRQPDSAYYNLDQVRQLYPRYPKLGEMFYNVGVNFYVDKKYSQAILAWKTCLTMDITPQIRGQAQNALTVLANQGIVR